MLVKGDVKDIPAGTPFYLETAKATTVRAYPVPEMLQSIINPSQTPPPAEEVEQTENTSTTNNKTK
jgi:hypothetical protein